MKRAIGKILVLLLLSPLPSAAAEDGQKHLYLCRSPLLAFDFWSALHDVQGKGITLTPRIVAEICANMKAGQDPQCIEVEAETFKPVASGWGGALALTDGKTKVWFHNPDSGGWVHPDYYVQFVNSM